MAPNKYPATEENTTLKAKRIFVISLKSAITDGATNAIFEVLNLQLELLFLNASAKILYKTYFHNVSESLISL
ncbi:hypothetical protein MHTCC0001_11000 [Flavobacteriaceae bacterium MHTCC 0001]